MPVGLSKTIPESLKESQLQSGQDKEKGECWGGIGEATSEAATKIKGVFKQQGQKKQFLEQ